MGNTPINIQQHAFQPRDRAFVVPPIAGIGETVGDTVTWTNATKGKARLWLANGAQVFESTTAAGNVNFSNPIDIAENGGKLTLTIKSRPAKGYYKYNVYCEAVNDYAQGNSEPGFTVP